MSTLIRITVVVMLLWATSFSFAQDEIPTDITERTFFIKAGDAMGTAFTVDYKGKVYLVTARHVVAGLPTSNATIQILLHDQWEDYKTVKTLFPASPKVDIAVFETNWKISVPYQIQPVGDKKGGISLGQQVWFLGYPFGISSHFKSGHRIPFIKRATLSAVDLTDTDAGVIFLDGFNNPGFSGGPVVFWDFSTHSYRLFAVVSGYEEDTAKVIVNGQHLDTSVLVNTGIIVTYSMRYAMEAIEHAQDQSSTTK